MSDLRKNQIKSVLYHILVAVVTYFFMMGKYIYEVMPNSAAVFWKFKFERSLNILGTYSYVKSEFDIYALFHRES